MHFNICLQITFEGITGNSYTGDVAIDEVKITEGKCPFSCNFDDGLCFWWSQSKSDDFDWTLHSGSTPSTKSGPSTDHSGSGLLPSRLLHSQKMIIDSLLKNLVGLSAFS